MSAVSVYCSTCRRRVPGSALEHLRREHGLGRETVSDEPAGGAPLYVVRTEPVPVEELREGDRLILPSGRRVTVERVDEFDDGFVVRWWRPAERGEPGHRGAKNHVDAVADEYDGRYLGSTKTVKQGYCFTVDRG